MNSKQNYELAFSNMKNQQYISAYNEFSNLASLEKSNPVKSALFLLLAAECKKLQGKEAKEEFEKAADLFLKHGKSNSKNIKGSYLCASKCFLKLNEFDKAKDAYHKAMSVPSRILLVTRPVVIIDDSKAIASKLLTYLENLGYEEIHVFYNGKEGIKGTLELISKEQLPIILLDMGLPDIEGDKVASKILETNVGLQIIVITADEKTTKRVHKTISSGVSGFIQKPFTINELKKALDIAESEYSLQQQ